MCVSFARHEKGFGMPEIRLVEEHEREKAIDCMVPAFVEDPTYRFMFEGSDNFLMAVRDNITGYCGSSLEDGTMWTINDFAGVSAWLRPGRTNDGVAIDASMKKWCPEDRYEDVLKASDQSADYQPNFPCWCLESIVVNPNLVGKGLGAQLLEHTLQKVDEQNMPVFLESTNPRNVSLYKRYGFEMLATLELGGTYMVTPMLRPAQG
jgi:GNAT superfamily N-acetyltransferase